MGAEVFGNMGMGLHLGTKVPPEGRDDKIGFYLLQQAVDVVLLHVVAKELSIIFKTPPGRTVGAVRIVIVTEFFIEGVP